MTYEPTYLGEIELSENTLKHYGVKGMKWRNKKGISKKSGTRRNKHHTSQVLREGESDYYYVYDPETKQTYKTLNMDKLMKRGKWSEEPFFNGHTSQLLRQKGRR